MELKKVKKVVIGSVITALTAVPIIRAVKLCYDSNKMANAMRAMQESSHLYPSTPDAYEEWIKYAPIEDVENFNNALISAKQSGTLSDAFLEKMGCESTAEFKEMLQGLYNAGKAGDTSAQEQFNSLYQQYQDDFFYQAVDKVQVEQGVDIGIDVNDFEIDAGSDGINIDTPVIAGVACAIIGACAGAYFYKEYKHKVAMEKRMRERQERERKNREKQKGLSR